MGLFNDIINQPFFMDQYIIWKCKKISNLKEDPLADVWNPSR